MRSVQMLPEGYREIYSVNLQKDKKAAILVNAIAVIIGIAMVLPAHFYIPITTLFSMDGGVGRYFLRFGVLLVSTVAYMVLHELVHGVAMKLCG